jgi:sec-independent protein translocase protein TatA
MPFKIGPLEIILILVVIFIIFGAGKLPNVAADIGKSIRNLKQAARDNPEPDKEKTEVKSKAASKEENKS